MIPDEDNMKIAVDIILLFLCIINIFLHILGIYLLTSIKKINKNTVQHLVIVNLSISEVCICVIRLVNIVTRLGLDWCDYDKRIIGEADHYFQTIIFTLLSFTYYFSILLITVDRLLACCLTVRYPIYLDVHKAKRVLIGISVIGVLIYVTTEVSYQITGNELTDSIYLYFYIPFDGIFVITAVFTYSVMFHRYKESVKRRSRIRSISITRIKRISTFQIFHKSKFYVSALLVLTFVMFNVTADLIYLFAVKVMRVRSEIIVNAIRISYMVSFLADGLVYIFLQPFVRRLLFQKIRLGRKAKYGHQK